MKYERAEELTTKQFRRFFGIKRETFYRMIEILTEAHVIKKRKGGRKNKLKIEDQLLMTFQYLREYRTYFHVGESFGVSETTALKTIRWVEDTLSKHKDFSIPKLRSETIIEIIAIDVTESPIQRPKKNKKNFIQERKKNIQ